MEGVEIHTQVFLDGKEGNKQDFTFTLTSEIPIIKHTNNCSIVFIQGQQFIIDSEFKELVKIKQSLKSKE